MLAGLFNDEMPDGSKRYPFWHKSIADQRKQWWKLTIGCFIATSLSILTFQPWYFGSYFRQEQNAYRVTCRVIDLDSIASGEANALVGPAIRQAIAKDFQANPGFHLGWQIETNENVLNTFALQGSGLPSNVSLASQQRGLNADEYAINLVLDQTVFGAIVIHANATSAATQAFEQGSTSYTPNGAISFYYEEARNFYTTNQYLAFYVTKMLESATQQAAQQFASRQLNSLTSANTVNFTALAQAIAPPTGRQGYSASLLTQPFAYSQFNLRPFDQLVGTAATTAGLIYLIIFTFYTALGCKSAFEPMATKLTLGSEIAARLAIPFCGYFFISLMYSLVTLAFQVDFTRQFGKGGFPLFWAMNFTSMLALGFAMEFILLAFGIFVFPFFLLFWVIVNVSAVFLDLSDIDHYYSYAFILPVWNAVDTAKAIIFATKTHLGQNFAVNCSWVVVDVLAISCLTIFKRMQHEREQRRQRVGKGVQNKSQ